MIQRLACTSDKTLPNRIFDALRMLRVGVRLGSDKPLTIDPRARRDFRFVLAVLKGVRKTDHVIYRRRLLFDIRTQANTCAMNTDVDLGFLLEIKADSDALEVFRWDEIVLVIPRFRNLSKAGMQSALNERFFDIVYRAVRVEQGDLPFISNTVLPRDSLPRFSPLHTAERVQSMDGVIYARPANPPPPRFRPLDVDLDRVDYRGEWFEFDVKDIIPEM